VDPMILVLVAAGVATAGVAFVIGRRSRSDGWEALRRLDEYEFYPFVVDETAHIQFDGDAFDIGVRHFLEHRNPRAARELIVIGEQNLVRETFSTDRLSRYRQLYEQYDGDDVVSDNDAYLENFRRIVHHIGRSFPNAGFEILLHNLVNPSRSLVAIENGEVTGRSIGSGATNLVLDLKTRRQQGTDKINYELNIGARRFKCTTIPIFRPDYGLIGAICINIDANFMRDAAESRERLTALIDNLLRTDFELDENILSKDEYRNALGGKRHYLDEAIRAPATRVREHRLAAIFFSDIVGFTALMSADETAALRIISDNEELHLKAIAGRGRILKRLGDGILASFDSASDAVAAAQEIQRLVDADGRFDVRIGIHVGEVVQEGSDVHGDGVNIASRIQDAVSGGQIGISGVVFENLRNKPGLTITALGAHRLKNVEDPIELFSVDPGL
jgi:class 3 adenylate cyclase